MCAVTICIIKVSSQRHVQRHLPVTGAHKGLTKEQQQMCVWGWGAEIKQGHATTLTCWPNKERHKVTHSQLQVNQSISQSVSQSLSYRVVSPPGVAPEIHRGIRKVAGPHLQAAVPSADDLA